MKPKKGLKLRENEGIVNEGGHEEQFHYTQEVVDEKGNVVIDNNALTSIHSLLFKKLGSLGKLISGSKSGYRSLYPKNFPVFNSNICIAEGKIWHGDVDLTLSKEVLIEIANKIGKDIYILYEMDARFENEDNPLLEKAAVVFKPDGTYILRDDLKKYYDEETLTTILKDK